VRWTLDRHQAILKALPKVEGDIYTEPCGEIWTRDAEGWRCPRAGYPATHFLHIPFDALLGEE
jgi:hypothetical protein